jgi:hypothetical protein
VVKVALEKQLAAYVNAKFNIMCCVAMTDYLQSIGIQVNPTVASQHATVIENKIRQIKERVRAILNSLPFNLPATMMKQLVSQLLSSLNMMPCGTQVDNISPNEAFTGRKIDYKRGLKVAFGDYVQAHVLNVTGQEVEALKAQKTGSIAIGSVGNLQGSIKAVITSSLYRISSLYYQALSNILTVLQRNKCKISKDPIFRFGYDINRHIDDNDVDAQVNNDTESVIDQLVDRTAVSIHDRVDIDVPLPLIRQMNQSHLLSSLKTRCSSLKLKVAT